MVELLRRAERLAELRFRVQPVVEGAVVERDGVEKGGLVDPDIPGEGVERVGIGDIGRVREQLGDPLARYLVAHPVTRIGHLHRLGHGGVDDRPGVARVLRQQGGGRRGGAGQRLVVKAPPLLVDPDVAGRAAEDEAAACARIAVVGRGVDVKPDIAEMGEIAAGLADQRMAGPGGIRAGAFHDPVPGEIRSDVEDHVEVGIEPSGRHQDGPAIHGDLIVVYRFHALEPRRAAGLDADSGDLDIGHDLAAARAIRLDQTAGQLAPGSARPGPADHRVALLRLHVGPLDAKPLRPEIEVVERVLDIVARPDRIGRRPAPAHPVVEGQVGAVLDPLRALQRRIHDQTAAARDDRRAARPRRELEGDRPRAGFAGLDPGGHSRSAGPHDGHIGLETPDTHFFQSRHNPPAPERLARRARG